MPNWRHCSKSSPWTLDLLVPLSLQWPTSNSTREMTIFGIPLQSTPTIRATRSVSKCTLTEGALVKEHTSLCLCTSWEESLTILWNGHFVVWYLLNYWTRSTERIIKHTQTSMITKYLTGPVPEWQKERDQWGGDIQSSLLTLNWSPTIYETTPFSSKYTK